MIKSFSSTFFLLLFLFSLNLLFVPIPANAGLVPCGRTVDDPATTLNEATPCTICHLVLGVEGIIQWGLKVMTYIAVAVIVAMGILYIVSAGNDSLMETAKKGITASLVGFVVMLGAWLMVNTVIMALADTTDQSKPLATLRSDGVFRFSCDITSNAGSASGVTANPGTLLVAPGGAAVTASANCAAYEATFTSAGNSSGVNPKLLRAIALKETGGSCNPGLTSPKGACGIMQLVPATAGKSCDELKSDPAMSIQIAANYLKTLQSNLNGYQSTFDIGNTFDLGAATVDVSGVSYVTSNDDLIAAYNAGSGNQMNGSLKGPFMRSTDCPGQNGRGIPAWQCPINPGGFTETQNYVRSVQASMR